MSAEEAEKLVRRERALGQFLIVVIVAAFLVVMLWGIFGDTVGGSGIDPATPADEPIPCQVQNCP